MVSLRPVIARTTILVSSMVLLAGPKRRAVRAFGGPCMPDPGAWRVHRPCARRTHVPGESTKALSAPDPRAWGVLRRPHVRQTHAPVVSTKAPCALDPRAWQVHSRTLFAGPTRPAGPQAVCAPEPGAWRVHCALCSAETRRLAGSQIRFGCQIHMPDGFTRLFSWIHCVPWRLHHLALSLLGLPDPQDAKISNGNQ